MEPASAHLLNEVFIVADLNIIHGPITEGILASVRALPLFSLFLTMERGGQCDNLTPSLLWSKLSLSLVSLMAMMTSLNKAVILSVLI